MANEFVHTDAGAQLTRTEDNAIGRHKFNSQATGDILYASSATQLSRLAKGAANTVLAMGASIPAWSATLSGLTFVAPVLGAATATSINKITLTQPATGATLTLVEGSSLITAGAYAVTLTATNTTGITLPTTGTLATLAGSEELTNKTLNASVAKGTWTASGTWTIPAVTLGGNMSAGDNIHLYLGTGNDIDIYHDGTNSNFKNNAGALIFNYALPYEVYFGGGETDLEATHLVAVYGARATAEQTMPRSGAWDWNAAIWDGVSKDYEAWVILQPDAAGASPTGYLNFFIGAVDAVGGASALNIHSDGRLEVFGDIVGQNAVSRISLGETADTNLTLDTWKTSTGAFTSRLSIAHSADEVVATWAGVTHTGIKLSGSITGNAQTMTGMGTITLGTGNYVGMDSTSNVTFTANAMGLNVGSGSATINTTAGLTGLTLQTSNDTHGFAIGFVNTHTTPTVGTVVQRIYAQAYDGNVSPALQSFSVIDTSLSNVTDGAEQSDMSITLWAGGASNQAMTLSGAGALWSDLSVDTLTYKVSGTQVLGAQGAAVADATDAASVILRLNDLLARCRAHGIIAT